MPFSFTRTEIPDVILISPMSFPDERGYFFENYKKTDFLNYGINYDFVQDNSSYSEANVIRGLHFQSPPHEQGKLVRVIIGKIVDVAVDIRKKSPTYGKWVSVILSADNKKMLWIPPGFAHGFLTLEKSYVHYKVTKEYNKGSEGGVIWSDPDLDIKWGIKEVKLSSKDESWATFRDIRSPFDYRSQLT
jgi:dTDP-4-dehydrorhamnose 3,5-epimerase